MPGGGMTDDQLRRYFDRPDFDSSILSPEEKQRLMSLTAPADDPTSFIKDVGRGAWDQGKSILKGFKEVGSAAMDVGRAAMGDPALGGTISTGEKGEPAITSMLKGFGTGAVAGMKNFATHPVESQEAFTGVHAAGDQPIGEKVGRTITNVGAMALPFIPRGVRAAGRVMERGVEGGILRGAEAIADAGSRVKAGTGVAAPEAAARTPYGHGEATREPFQPRLRDIELTDPDTGTKYSSSFINDQGWEEFGPRPGAPADAGGSPPTTPSAAAAELKETIPEKPVDAVATATRRSHKPVIKVVSDPPGTNRVWIDGVEQTQFGPGGPTDYDIRHLYAVLGDPSTFRRLEELKNRPSTPSTEPRIVGKGSTEAASMPPDRNLGAVSDQDRIFEEMMNQLHPEDEGPLPGNGTFDATGATPQVSPEEFDEWVRTHDAEFDRQKPHNLSKPIPGARILNGKDFVAANKRRFEADPTLSDLRSGVGAEEAARDPRFKAAAAESGIPADRASVQDITGTPSRQPLKKVTAELDNDFLRHLMDERGSIQFGPKWKSIKEMFGFGGKEPEAISKDPFAMKEGPMDRRNFLYRASGTPRKLTKSALEKGFDGVADNLAGREIYDVDYDGTIDLRPEVETEAAVTLNRVLNKNNQLQDIAARHNLIPDSAWNGLDPTDVSPGMDELGQAAEYFGMADSAWEAQGVDAATRYMKKLGSFEPPSMLEAFTGETEKEFGSAVKEGEASETAATSPKSADGSTSLEDAATQMSFLDKIRKRLKDNRGSAQVAPEGWFKSRNKPVAADADYAGDVKSMIESDNIRRGKGSPDSWIQQALDSKLKKLKDETGSFSPGAIVDVLNQVRVMSFLSGLAVPKSILGNVNAMVTAAIERGDFAPIKEMFNLPQNIHELKQAWQSTANPAAIAGAGKINIPGRVMGALDQTTQAALERAGLTTDEGQRLLLQRPNPVGNANFGRALKSPVGRFVWPFQRTPFNQLAEGISPDLVRDPGGSVGGSIRRAGLTAAAGGAGYELSQNTKDPRILGLAAALSGVRGVPMLLGAAMGGGGRNAVAGISPIPEWGIPSSTKDLVRLTGLDPAAIKAYGLDQGKGRTPTRQTTRTTRKTR